MKKTSEVEVYRRAATLTRTRPLPKRGTSCSLLFASKEWTAHHLGEDHMRFRCDMSAIIVDALINGSELLNFKARMEDLWPLLSNVEKQILVKHQPRFATWLHEDVEQAANA